MKTGKVIASGIIASSMLGITLIASAETGSKLQMNANKPEHNSFVLEIGPKGRTLLRGEIVNISGNSLSVKSWGGNWTINISSSTQILPGKNISKFAVGDFLGIQGKTSTSSSFTVDSSLIRNWTYRESIAETRKENAKEAKKIVQSNTPRNFVGKIETASGTTLTIKENKKIFTLNVSSSTKIYSRIFSSITLSDIKTGDSVRIWGTSSGSIIEPLIIRNISVPKN